MCCPLQCERRRPNDNCQADCAVPNDQSADGQAVLTCPLVLFVDKVPEDDPKRGEDET